jgi:hypothetical protein
MVVHGWLEQPEEDIPPEEIWHHSERLEEWFESVKQRREDGGSGRGHEVIEDAPMTQNDLTAEVIGESDG